MPFFLTQYVKSMSIFGENFGEVTPTIFRSAQPDKDRLKYLAYQLKVEYIINLRDDLKEEEFDECDNVGIILYNYPMSDSKTPSSEQVDKVLHSIDSSSKISPTLVCCKGGRHRTGLIIACYRIRFQGWTKEAAWKEAEKYGWYSTFGHKPLKDFFFNSF